MQLHTLQRSRRLICRWKPPHIRISRHFTALPECVRVRRRPFWPPWVIYAKGRYVFFVYRRNAEILDDASLLLKGNFA